MSRNQEYRLHPKRNGGEREVAGLARIFHESLAATADMTVLPGVLRCRSLRRTVQVRLETNTLRLPGGTPILAVSPQQFMRYPGEVIVRVLLAKIVENKEAQIIPIRGITIFPLIIKIYLTYT